MEGGRHCPVENDAFHDSRPVFVELVGRIVCSSFDSCWSGTRGGCDVYGGGGRGLGRMETPEKNSKLMKFYFVTYIK